MDETTWAVLAWCLAVVLLGWTWLPAFLSGLGWTRYTNGGSEDPTQLGFATEPDFVFWAQQLTALGYEPLGSGWMRVTFNGPEWRYQTEVRVFRSNRTKTFAFVQKQPRPLDVWWLTMFATCWQDGGLLLTSNAADQPPSDGDYVVQGMESMDLNAVEELHRAQVARLQHSGRRIDPDGSLDTLLRATQQHAGVAARQTGMKLGQTYLLTHAAIHAVLSVPAAATMGLLHWSVPMVNVVLGSVLAVSYHAAKSRAGNLQKAEIQSRLTGSATDSDRNRTSGSPGPSAD
jgi:hypothetical protein